jgi:hypothetical protein
VRLSDPAAELYLGIGIGLEPEADFAADSASGVLVTRSSSWWTRTRCKTCRHTFRRGDRVLVDAAMRTVQHLVPGIECGTDPDPDPSAAGGGAGRDRDEFTAGLLATWPAPMAVTRLADDDWRIPRPGSGHQARAPECLYCGHTFRSGEYVVICPCQAARDLPATCGAAVHRDPAAGLPCWERWQPAGQLTICPTTMARL